MAVDKAIEYKMQGGVKNYRPSKMVKAPVTAKSSPDTPTAHLAYITPEEQDILIDLNLYGSLKGKPNRGPSGIPSLEGDFGGPGGFGGFQGGGGSRSDNDVSGSRDRGTGDYRVTDRAVQDAYNKNRAIREANERAVDKLAGRDSRLSGGIKTNRGPMGGLGSLIMSGLGMLMGIPGLGLLTGGLGSLGNKLGDTFEDFTGTMRGINPITGKPNTQAEYEAMVADRKTQSRIDKMQDRINRGYNQIGIGNFTKTTGPITDNQRATLAGLLGQKDRFGNQFGPSTAQNVLTGRDLKGFTESRGLQTPKTFSDPFANTVGTTTKVNAPSNDAVSSVTRDYSGIEDYGVDINPQGSKSIFKSLFPEGNLQDIIKNSKTQKDYNINATKDLVENLPGGVVKEAIAPALAGVLSPFYDSIQGIYRGATNPNKSILQALKDENIGSSMKERFTGAAAPLAERFANLNFSNPFISSAAAAEISPTIGMETTPLGFSIPTGDVGFNTSGRLGNLSATVDAIDALKGESVNPQINYSGDFGNTLLGGQTNVFGNLSDDVQNIGLNFNNDKGLSGGISYDAITGEPRFNIGFKRTFADGGIASMFTRRG